MGSIAGYLLKSFLLYEGKNETFADKNTLKCAEIILDYYIKLTTILMSHQRLTMVDGAEF
jgi:hypothetical protein